MSERSHSPNDLRSPSPRLQRRDRSFSPRRGRSYSPRSTRSSSSRSYSRSRSRSRSYSRRRRSPSRSPYRRSSSYRHYYSRSPPHHHRRSPPPPRRYRSRSPQHFRRKPPVNKDCRVYVSNLPFDTSWQELKDLMREAGQVSHVDVLKLANGRSKGCGVVEYRYPEGAKRAIHMLNEAKFMGRTVFVREDRDYDHTGPPRDPRDAPDDCRLHVSNLPLNASWQDMKDLFRRAGRVLHTDVHTDIGSRRPNGHGTVIFDDPRFARAAIDIFNGYEWQGHRLEVKEGRYIERTADNNDNSNPSPPSLTTTTSTTGLITEIPINGNYNRYPLTAYEPPPPMTGTVAQETATTTTAIATPISTATTTINTSSPPQAATTTIQPQAAAAAMMPTATPPLSIKQETYNMYRYKGAEANIPPPVLHHQHLPPPPPPPLPIYATMGLVGGPAANLPTHGHNQIFVNNVSLYTLICLHQY
ncbi:MAG: hypothetical protein EXX96DRAFT_568234 [Benjaminiella poitrasii]|nr:MAG: hypothetical protein EXX96DRAFT_568234 [Benjaminiella poitrasii]